MLSVGPLKAAKAGAKKGTGVMLPETDRSIGSRRRLLDDYRDALALTNGLIDRSPAPPKNPSDVRARAEYRLGRFRRLLAALGDPHLQYPVIHVAGTSGKGSTAIAAAAMLSAAGLHVGLHTSPYLQVATEKVQIDGALIDATTFRAVVEEVIATAAAFSIAPVTYGEVWFALTALAFARAEVDISVIEVGAGGRFDLTNVVEPAVSVITSVGLDHMETLGGTILEIAWHKSGIIKPGIPVVSAVTDLDAIDVINREAFTVGSRVIPVVAGETFGLERAKSGHFLWWANDQPEEIYSTSMRGRFQAVNAATAVAAIRALPAGFVTVTPETVRVGLTHARLQGRFELMQVSPTVVLDGAHNPEKMRALVRDLRAWRTDHPGSRLIAVVGVLETKDHRPMLAEIARIADELVTTSPQVLAKPGADAATLAQTADEIGFSGPVAIVDDPMAALESAIARADEDDLVVVTGSLYLVGNVRGRWYPDDEIVIQQTPWPAARKSL